MKASEIRIGIHIIDVFNPNNPIERQIDFDDLAMLKNYKNHPLPFKPIPLTEEWLLKFGFEKVDLQYVKFVHEEESDFIGALHDIGFAYYVDKDDERPLIYVKYVHQLQNLYFALTNEELTLKQN